LISIIIPTKNEEKYLGDLLKSIKKQTYKNYEILVGDYKSTDKTREIARKYGARVINIKKKGFAAGRNGAFKYSKGQIIAFIDADFVLSKTVFEDAIKSFNEDPKLVCVQPFITLRMKALPKRSIKKFKLYLKIQNIATELSFYTKFPLPTTCVICRRDAITKSGLFREDLDLLEDIDFHRRLRRYGSYKVIRSTAKMCMRRFAKEGLFKVYVGYYLYSLIINTLGIKNKRSKLYLPIR